MRARAGVVAAVLCLGLAAPVGASAGPGSPRTAIVSLGDSFASGEGGRWLGNASGPFEHGSGTDRSGGDPAEVYGDTEESGCHRSDVAPILSAPIAVDAAINIACSGATARNLWPAAIGGLRLRGEPPQGDRLAGIARSYGLRLVVVTAGANDVGFGRIVARCALDWVRSSPASPRHCRERARSELESRLPAMRQALLVALREIRMTMTGAGYAREEYRLLVMGYASPFPGARSIRYPEEGWSRLNRGGCPFWDADVEWAAGWATPSIVAAMHDAADAVGAEFLDLQRALDGHQLCDRRARRVGPEGPDPATAEWVRRLGFAPGSVRESLHPNAYGQRAIGACVALHYEAPAGDHACRATPGRGHGAMRLEPLGN